jgi:hypothetical protein
VLRGTRPDVRPSIELLRPHVLLWLA